MEAVTPPARTLHRSLGPLEVMFLTFSALSPAMSVFILGGGILHMAGTGAAVAIIVGGAVAAVATFLYAELGAAFPKAGGVYPGLVGVLGPVWAFPYITMMMAMAPTTLAFTLLGFADYVRVLAPSLPQIPVALACLVLAAGVATLRIRTGAVVTGVFLAIEVLALITLAIVAMLHPVRSLSAVLTHPITLDHGALKPLTVATAGLAIVSGVFTCAGASWAMYFGEEMKDAPRRIGTVMVWVGLIGSVAIAAPLTLMVLATVDLKSVLSADAPVAAYLSAAAGPGLAAVVSGGIVIAIFNAIAAMILGYSRLFYGTGRDGIWPRPVNRLLAHLHPGMRSPIAATAVLGALAAALMFIGEQPLLILSSGENIMEYALMAAAVLIGRRTGQVGAHFRAPLHPLIPMLALGAALAFVVAEWFDPESGRPSLLFLAALFVGSLVYYRLRMRSAAGGWAVAARSAERTPEPLEAS